MKSKVTRKKTDMQLAFLGLGAMEGSAVLIISLSGKFTGMPLSMLTPSPFSNFLIAGIILFFVLGVIPFLVLMALRKKQYLNWLSNSIF